MKSKKIHHPPPYRPQTFRGLSAIFLVAASLAMASAAQRKLLPGHVPAAISGLQPLGRLDPSTRLKLSLALPLRNREALTNLLVQIYDPGSPRYHHYLTPDEFDARFGPTKQDYAAATAFATSNGFTIVAQHPNRMLLEISAAVPDIERAFQVTLRTYAHPTEKRTFFAPDTDPSVSADVPTLSIGGLDNFSRAHPANLRHTPIKSNATTKATVGSGPNGNLAGFDYRAAYVPGVSLNGSGQQVGLVEFDGYYPGDITSYLNQTGLTNVPLNVVLLDGFSGVPTTGASSGNSEVALDIEMAISMAPALSGVVVYEDDPNLGQLNNVLQAMSTNTVVKQFSCSWAVSSLTTSQRTTMDNYFLKFAAQGQSFFCASGDTGALSGTIPAPGDDPNITIVGGTTLGTASPGGAWLSETVWNPGVGPGNGSSGGVSTIYSIPPWQQGVNLAKINGSTSKRNFPDVAMVADNLFIVADNGVNETVAGTSGAAPLWAGFTALANQQAVANHQATLGFFNPALYHLGTNSAYTGCFNDVTVGNNTNSNANRYFAAPGYDLCTGWGSAIGSSLLLALTRPDGFQVTPGSSAVGNGPVGGPFTTTVQTFTLTNTGTSTFNWSLGNTSAWLNVSSTGGTLTPAGSAAVTATLNASANLLPGGVYAANLWFTNLASGQAQLRQFSLQVDQDLTLDGGFEANDFCYWTLTGSDASVYTDNFVDNGTYTAYSPEEGNDFAAMGQATTLAYLSQSLPTHAGQVYELSFWLENPSGATPNQFQVQWNTNGNATHIIFNQANMGTFGWSNLVFTVVAATNVTTLRFGFRNDNDYFAFDGVSVTPVASPVFQAITVVNGRLQLTWSAVPGQQYQVQLATRLAPPNWANVGSPVTAIANPMTVTESLGSDPGSYFRIVGP